MSADQCDLVDLSLCWGQVSDDDLQHQSKPQQIAALLLAKLADFLIPGELWGRRSGWDISCGS